MVFAWIGLVLCQLTPGTFSATVNITALGTEFLLAFPRLRYTKINLLMYTRAELITVNLSLTNPGSSNHSRLNEVIVQKSTPVPFHQSTIELDIPSKEYSHHRCLLLTSDQPFGVHVHLYDGNDLLSSFMALPVQAFGRVYMVITQLTRPFFIVIAQRKTKIFVSLDINPAHDLLVDGALLPVGSHNWRTILLESYQAFSLTKCLDKSLLPNISLTGSKIESVHPIGVISGSCSSIQDNCKENDYSSPDLSSEMLVPERMYGLTFVIVNSPNRTDKDFAWVTPSEPNTTTLFYYKQYVDKRLLKDSGATMLNYFNLNGYVVSDRPVAIYLYINTTCQYHRDKGGPSISVVIPNDLFFNFYAWVNPPLQNVVNFISLVLKVYYDFKSILFNGGPIPYINVTKDEGLTNFSYYIVVLELASNATDGCLETYFFFGCYFSGFSSQGSYFQAAGFNYLDEKYNCSLSDEFNGDVRDNDCDGMYDEESKNKLDDDGDGLIDEDTYNVSGCSMFGKWGRHCLYGCSDYCRDDCDKDTGVCSDCVDGRMKSPNNCLDACPVFTYGNYCQENCSIKCNGKDCYDRYTGQCEPLEMEVPVHQTTAEPNGTTAMSQTREMPDTFKPNTTTIPTDSRKETTTTTTPVKLPETTPLPKGHYEEHERTSVFTKMFLGLVVISCIIGIIGVIYFRIKAEPSIEEMVEALHPKPPVMEEEKEKEISQEKKTMSKEEVPETPKKSMESVNAKKLSMSSEATSTWV